MTKNSNKRKFLVSSITATMVAAAVAPVAGFAATPASFPDVPADHAYAGAITDMAKANIIKGMPNGNFDLGGKITRSQAAQMVAGLLDLKTGEEANATDFTDVKGNAWYTGAINSLVAKKIVAGQTATTFAPDAKITRGELAVLLVKAYGLEKVNVDNVELPFTDVAEGMFYEKSIKILHSEGLIKGQSATKFAPKEDMKRGDFAWLSASVDYVHGEKLPKPVKPVVTATKVASVSATNLKEVVVTFDGTVDATTAEDDSNYSISNAVVSSAALSEDKKSVTLTLDTDGNPAAAVKLTNQVEYKLSFNNIKAGDKDLSVKDYKFTPVDATLPSVTGVTALGNKTVRVTFSEPIVSTIGATSFTIDGKPVVGTVTATGDNTAIVKVFSALADGAHKISVKDVVDYSGLKSLNQELDFTVVNDTVAPTIDSVVKATFEKVTVKFSEPVDPSTLFASNVYWMQGTSKFRATGNPVKVSDDTYTFDFTGNKIQYATDLYIVGVKDYSGNTIADGSKIQVNPVVDQTRPEIASVEYNPTNKNFVVKFNKTLDKASAEKVANYVVKDSDGDVVSKYKTVVLDPSDKKKVIVTLGDALTAGKTYTLEIAGVSDTTTLKNVMMPFTKTIVVSDKTAPELAATVAPATPVVRNTSNNTLVVSFNEKMATSGDGSIVDTSKYLYSTTASAPYTWKALPDGATVNVQADGKSAIISFPTSEQLVSGVTALRVQLVKDEAGNFLKDLTADTAVSNQSAVSVSTAAATETNKVVLTFTRPILANTVNLSDFAVTANGVNLGVIGSSVNSSGTKLTLTLSDSNALNENGTYTIGNTDYTVSVGVNNASTATADGMKISNDNDLVTDSIAATVDTVTGSTDGSRVFVAFNENLKTQAAPGDTTTIATDFVVKDEDGNIIAPGAAGYNVTVSGKVATINFATPQQGIMSVQVVNPRFLMDATTAAPTVGVNVVSASDEIQVAVHNYAPTASIASTTGATNDASALKLTFNQPLYDVNGALTTGALSAGQMAAIFDVTGTAATVTGSYSATDNSITLAFAGTAVADQEVVVVKANALKNFAGVVYAPETLKYNTTGTVWTK